MTKWSDVVRALETRPDFRRRGQEWHGPCPVTSVGKTKAWFGPGAERDGVRAGCRHCGETGGKLNGDAFREHLVAVVGASDGSPGGRPRIGSSTTVEWRKRHGGALILPDRVWRSARSPAGSPGELYLVRRRAVWPAELALPPSVRWLPASRARILRRRLPDGAVGVIVYRFVEPGDVATMAVQVEAVAADGERVSFPPGAKRVSVEGSRFGPRVFWAVGDVANGVHVCEGVTDALALFHLQCLGAGFRAAAALGVGPTAGICGVHSASGFRLEAIPGSAPVIVWPDGDPAGNSAAGRGGGSGSRPPKGQGGVAALWRRPRRVGSC